MAGKFADVTCRTDGGVLIQNEVGTSRPCSEQSPKMIGDFGPSPIKIVSLLASDPTGLGSRYRAGNAITVLCMLHIHLSRIALPALSI